MTDTVFVDLIEDEPMSYDEFRATFDAFRSESKTQQQYSEYLDRFQPFRWHAENAGNHKIGAVGERYFNKEDAKSNIKQQYGSGTTVFLREAEHGLELLRRGYPNDLGEVIELAEDLTVTRNGSTITWKGVNYYPMAVAPSTTLSLVEDLPTVFES
jgi:uncharacterized protein YegP (UPF0339 family)